MRTLKLSADDREFFALLAGVVFGNPFSRQRDELIVRLAPDQAGFITGQVISVSGGLTMAR